MEKKKKSTIIIACILFILIAIIGVLVFLLLGKRESGGSAENSGSYMIEEDNYQQIMDDMRDEVREGYFETYMNTVWTFADGTSETKDGILGNSPNNTKAIRCEILLADTEEMLFSTGVIPVGAQVPPFKLDVDLDAGRYDAVCMTYLLDEMEDGTYKDYSSAGFNVTIIVEN